MDTFDKLKTDSQLQRISLLLFVCSILSHTNHQSTTHSKPVVYFCQSQPPMKVSFFLSIVISLLCFQFYFCVYVLRCFLGFQCPLAIVLLYNLDGFPFYPISLSSACVVSLIRLSTITGSTRYPLLDNFDKSQMNEEINEDMRSFLIDMMTPRLHYLHQNL